MTLLGDAKSREIVVERDQIELMLHESAGPSGFSTPISEVPPFSDSRAAAERLADVLLSLPWSYELLLPLPIKWGGADERAEVRLDEEYQANRFTAADAQDRPIHEVDSDHAEYYHRDFPETLATDNMFLIGNVSGYIPARDPSTAVEEFINAWKGLIGLLLVDLSFVEAFGTSPGAPRPSHPIIVYRVDGGARRLEPYKWLSLEDTAVLQRFAETDRLLADPERSLRAIAPAFVDMRARKNELCARSTHGGAMVP